MKSIKIILTLLISSIFIVSCSDKIDDDGNTDTTCTTITDQIGQGVFKGTPFTITDGTHRLQFNKYYCRIYISTLTGGDCAFPEFGGNEGVIIFSLENLDPQTITLSDVIGQGESLNFNSRIGTTTEVELAECGQLEILSSTATTVNGRVIAKGQEGSSIDGNFTLTICTL